MYAALALSERRACTVWQVHSVDVVMVTNPVRGRRWLALADAMITDRADTPLAMRFADCTPLLFRDPGIGDGSPYRPGINAGLRLQTR
jgi:copper oxidase (laccase) domain-containing protein